MIKATPIKDFLLKLNQLTNNEYELISEYKNMGTNVLLKHKKCNYEWNVRPSAVIHQNQRCPKCRGVLKKTTDDFINDVKELTGDEYTVLGDYKNAHVKISMIHNYCNHEYEITPHNFLLGNRCPFCNSGSLQTHEMFMRKFHMLEDCDEYKILSEYKKAVTKMSFLHTVCNKTFDMTPNSFLGGTRCPHCFGTIRRSTEDFKKEIYNLVGDEFEVLGEYKNNHTPVLMRHNTCGTEWMTIPSNFLKRKLCINCNGMTYYDTEMFKEKVHIETNGDYEVLGEYVNTATKILIKHNSCNNVYSVIPNSFLNGARCPHCASSKGEKAIKNFLVENNIVFDYEFTFPDCLNKGRLIFDFAIFEDEEQNALKCLIEYDGKQHFKPIDWFGGIESFKRLKINDEIKNKYCESKNIKLIRIPYWEFKNINNILSNEFIFV